MKAAPGTYTLDHAQHRWSFKTIQLSKPPCLSLRLIIHPYLSRLLQGCEKALALRQHFKGTTSSSNTKVLQLLCEHTGTIILCRQNNVFPSMDIRLANGLIILFYSSPYSTGNCSLKLFLTKFQATCNGKHGTI